MPAITTIVVSAVAIMSAANTIFEFNRNIQDVIGKIRDIRTDRVNSVWKGEKNVDSNEFCMRMEELEQDVKKMLDCLDEYEQVLKKSAQEYEKTQQQVRDGAANLKRPTG